MTSRTAKFLEGKTTRDLCRDGLRGPQCTERVYPALSARARPVRPPPEALGFNFEFGLQPEARVR